MEEVADTLRELGVEPLMTAATVKRQREMGQIGKQQSVRGVSTRTARSCSAPSARPRATGISRDGFQFIAARRACALPGGC